MNALYEDYLKKIDEVIEKGKYKDNWESLSAYPVPKWYREAKFGAFIHWGAYSVPAYFNEWYPRMMHYKGNPTYWHHKKKYGIDYPYRKFIDQFTAPRFNAAEWVKLLKGAGMKYIMPVGEHHDGYKMYDSELSRWTTMKQAMKRDVLGEIREECIKQDVTFATSSHRAEHYWFLNGAATLGYPTETMDSEYADLYGDKVNVNNKNNLNELLKNERGITPSEDWLKDWLVSSAELIDKYRPLTLFFDWWVSHKAFRPYMKKFLAYYFNRSLEWGKEVCVQYKSDAIMYNCSIYDCERGQLPGVRPYIWQSETSTAYNSWCYTKSNHWKKPETIASVMADVFSKIGNFVLNIGPKSDGTICEKEVEILNSLGNWTGKNYDAIWGTQPYKVYGEGKRKKAGSFKEIRKYSLKDYRYTYKTGHVYAFALVPRESGVYRMKALREGRDTFYFSVLSIKLLGYENKIKYNLTDKYLEIKVEGNIDTRMPLCFDIEVD
jgi:alpha-L-fucosidase